MESMKIRLSEAIRKGCQGTVQSFNVFFDGDKGRDVVAAAMAGSGHPSLAHFSDFRELYHAELRKSTKCPECITSGPLEEILTHLNDEHKVTREWVAEWLESREL